MDDSAECQRGHIYAECAVYMKNPAERQHKLKSTLLPPLGFFS